MAKNDTTIINIDSTQTAVRMFDKLSRMKSGRRVNPLTPYENVAYAHRYYYDEYNLQIGDTAFMIPPEFIMISSEAPGQSVVMLRQENTQKAKSGYHRRTLLIDLVFNNANQLNGYPVAGPEGIYYMDGLRQLLAQFKLTPILPITNELINSTYAIFTVALQSITMSTLDGFPGAMTAQITLQEVNLTPYIEMPDASFKYMIDWDLFRFYYQRMMTNDHEYKKFQRLPANKEYNKFRISILDSSVFESDKANKANFLDLIMDREIVRVDPEGGEVKTNYVSYVDSDMDNTHICSFQCGYSNLLTNIQLSDMPSPTVQFLGGMDTIYNITFETTNKEVVQKLEKCQIENDVLTRNNIKLRSVGFVKIESELVEFTGSLFVAVETVTTNTVPGFPGLYNVQINCVSYDVYQGRREALNGFKPFDGAATEDRAIDQNWSGLKEKIKQDNYAENKIRETMEVYPDLYLPTHAEVDEFIQKCRDFREANGLSQLPYTSYPLDPVSMLHGCKQSEIEIPGDIAYPHDVVPEDLKEYRLYVDPDFYVFYPSSYESFMTGDDANYYQINPKQRSGFSKTITEDDGDPDDGGSGGSGNYYSGNLANKFVELCASKIGRPYVWGAAGENETWDCSGLVTWGLKQIGVMPQNQGRFTVETIASSSMFKEVPYEQRQRGDVICNNALSHVVICEGDGNVVHASNSSPYPQGGVKRSKEYFQGRVFRPIAFIEDSNASSSGPKQAIGGTDKAKAWNLLKAYGLTDVAAAGAMGNFDRETGGTFSPKIVQGGSYSDTIPSSGGYGLPQYTYSGYKTGLQNYCANNGVGVNTAEGQIGYLMSVISGTNWFKQMNSTSSIEEATRLFCDNFEKPGVVAIDDRINGARQAYQEFAGTGGTDIDAISSKYTLTNDELDSICRYVYNETIGEGNDTAMAVAQSVYDTITDTNVGLGSALNNYNFPNGKYNGSEVPSAIVAAVKDVFCNGSRAYSNKIKAFVKSGDKNKSTANFGKAYQKLGTKGNHTFWGTNSPSSSEKYVISDTNGTSSTSSSGGTKTSTVNYEAMTLTEANLAYFAEPVLVRTSRMVYGVETGLEEWTWENFFGTNHRTFSREELNSGVNIFNTAYCNMYHYSAKGKLLKAFPAYLFCILDEESQWFDGRKLWTNYYIHKSCVDIAVHKTNDMPTETATIVISNSYHNLDVTQGGLSKYKVSEDPEYKFISQSFTRWVYDITGMVPSLKGPKITDMMMELHSIIYEHAKLREGARVHLRMGYGSDPFALAPMINGSISDIALGDQITMVITSDGNELIKHVTSTNEKKKKDTNNGWLGLFGLGENQEASDIIANIMVKRQSWISKLSDDWFEGSKYGIEHFGLYFSQNVAESINNIWAGQKEQYDILMNLYTANYEREHYITCNWLRDGEENVVFNKYSMTPWDVFQLCTQQAPEYILKASMHQFDSRLYYGCPTWMEKYRYNIFGGEEEMDVSTETGNNSDGGSFNDNANEYNSGPQGKPGMFKVTIYVQMDAGHNNPSTSDPDVVNVTVGGNTKELFRGNLGGSGHSFTLDANDLNGASNFDIFVHTPPSHKNCCKTAKINWTIEYQSAERLGRKNGVIWEEAKSSTQCHYIDSVANIIDNQCKVTSKFTNTNIKVMYTRGGTVMPTKLLKSDATIDNAYQKTTILDSPIVQDALGPDALYDLFGYDLGYQSAKRIGVSNLLYGWQQEYQGQIFMLGNPGINPHDYMLVNDGFANMYGLCTVREVIHSFNTNTGFTTSITPGMVGFSTAQDSGLIVQCQNMLMMLQMFSAFTEARRQLLRNYEHYIDLFASFEVIVDKLEDAIKYRSRINTFHNVKDVASDAYGIYKAGQFAVHVKNLIKSGKTVKDLAVGAKNAYTTIKAAKTSVAGIKGFMAAVKATTDIVGASTGIGLLVSLLIWAVIDALLDEFFEWLENRNLVCLMPMWWEDYPFVNNVKDGKHILLTESNARASEDQDARANEINWEDD